MEHARGYTLVEVTVAVAIIGLMVVTTGVLLQRIPASGREVRDQDRALKVARAEIEVLRAGGYGALPPSGPFTNPLLSSLASSSAAVAVTDVNDQTKQVVATVSWLGAAGAARSVSLTTLVVENSGLP